MDLAGRVVDDCNIETVLLEHFSPFHACMWKWGSGPFTDRSDFGKE